MPLARFPGGDLSSDATDVLSRLQDVKELGGRFRGISSISHKINHQDPELRKRRMPRMWKEEKKTPSLFIGRTMLTPMPVLMPL